MIRKGKTGRSMAGTQIDINDAEGKYCRLYDTGNEQIEGKKGVVYQISPYNDYGSGYSNTSPKKRISIQFLDIVSGSTSTRVVDRTTHVRHLTVLSKASEEGMRKFCSRMVRTEPRGGVNLGTDPEVFVVNGGGEVIPAFSFLPSKKVGNPYWDGFQAEFTVTPGGCLAFLTDRVREELKNVYTAARKFDKSAKLTWKSVLDIPEGVMMAADFEHANLGCAPSTNVYKDVPKLEIDNPRKIPFRFAGCHMHFGVYRTEDNMKATLQQWVRGLDAVLGVMSVVLFRGMEDPRRRKFYGRAGEHRTPKHGLEYRTMSSAMLAHPILFHLCFDVGRCSMSVAEVARSVPSVWVAKEGDVREAIDNYNVKLAQKILATNNTALRDILEKRYGSERRDKILEMLDRGALDFFDGLKEMSRYWRLEPGMRWIDHSDSNDACVGKLSGTKTKGGF